MPLKRRNLVRTILRLRKTLITLTNSERLYQGEIPLVGLTGGVATGKSTVTEILRDNGLPVICADELVKKIYLLHEAKEFLKHHFPSNVFQGSTINFSVLRSQVFKNSTLRNELESFIYTLLPEQFRQEAEEVKDQKVLFYDVPLLFEKGLDKKVDISVCVYCHENQQRERLAKRDNINASLIEQILKAQWPIEKKRECAQKVIINTSTKEDLAVRVEELLEDILTGES